jgi:hypothetical protein
MGKSY